MKIFTPRRYPVGTCVFVALLAACNGGAKVTPPSAARAATSAASALPSLVEQSWMTPNAAQQALLYVSGFTTGNVYVFSYPTLQLAGMLTGLQSPSGQCVDAVGDIFVTEFSGQAVREYAHGSSTPKVTLKDPGYKPVSCTVDSTTGNLAVGNISPISGSGQGNVAIYKRAAGAPIAHHSASGVYNVYYCGYDNSGNLYVDGLSNSRTANLAKLPKGKKSLQHVYLDQSIGFPGSVQWDGRYLAVGDLRINTIYRFSVIKQSGKKIGAVQLRGGSHSVIGDFWIQGLQVVGLDVGKNDVGIWKYPLGGPALNVHSGIESPGGATVSTVRK